jgi:hypothetical protein
LILERARRGQADLGSTLRGRLEHPGRERRRLGGRGRFRLDGSKGLLASRLVARRRLLAAQHFLETLGRRFEDLQGPRIIIAEPHARPEFLEGLDGEIGIARIQPIEQLPRLIRIAHTPARKGPDEAAAFRQ